SHLYIGDFESSMIIGLINYIALVPETVEWRIEMDGFSINDKQYRYKRHALMDTGTSSIVMPLTELNTIKNLINEATIVNYKGINWLVALCEPKLVFAFK